MINVEDYNPEISIIVPVYKVEGYLIDCVDSLKHQTFNNIEILLVDDGSPDRSGFIADELAKDDKRIRVFHKINEGVTRARAYGIEKAHGNWIVFVDSDDTLPPDAVSFLYDEAINHNYDICIATWRRITPIFQRNGVITLKGDISPLQYVHALLTGGAPAGILGKIIRKNLFDSHVMDIPTEITNNEDLIMNIRLAWGTSRIGAYPKKVVYNYFLRESSASARPMTFSCWEKCFEEVDTALSGRLERDYLMYVVGQLCRLFISKSINEDFLGSTTFSILNDKRKLFMPWGIFRVRLQYLCRPTNLNRFLLSCYEFIKRVLKYLHYLLFFFFRN